MLPEKIEQYIAGDVVKLRIRNPLSEKDAKEKLTIAAQEYVKTSSKDCVISEVYKLGKVSFGINIMEF